MNSMEKATTAEKTLYQRLLEAEIPAQYIDHHESDLYVRLTPKTDEIIEQFYKEKGMASYHHAPTFKANDGHIWFDCAFAYDPYWQEVARLSEDRKNP